MLAKSVNDNAGILDGRSILEFFASKLAPTVVFGGGSHRFLQIVENKSSLLPKRDI